MSTGEVQAHPTNAKERRGAISTVGDRTAPGVCLLQYRFDTIGRIVWVIVEATECGTIFGLDRGLRVFGKKQVATSSPLLPPFEGGTSPDLRIEIRHAAAIIGEIE